MQGTFRDSRSVYLDSMATLFVKSACVPVCVKVRFPSNYFERVWSSASRLISHASEQRNIYNFPKEGLGKFQSGKNVSNSFILSSVITIINFYFHLRKIVGEIKT